MSYDDKTMNRFTRPVSIGLIAYVAIGWALSGCAWFKPAPKPQPVPVVKPKPKPQAKPVDTAAQQRMYDKGLKHYTEENYDEAKKAWQQAVQMGQNTPLAEKARQNIRKADQALKTLTEIEKR